MKAKYYIYWNLHKDCYSVRFKGKVIMHCRQLVAASVTFKVSQKGRDRVLRERKKNVHAFVVADEIFPKSEPFDLTGCDLPMEQVKYNPYKYDSFVDTEEKPVYNCGMLWMISSKTPCLLRIK